MEHQKQVVAQVDTCIELIELMKQAPEANAVMVMQAMDRLQQLLAIPSAGCDGEAGFTKQEDGQ